MSVSAATCGSLSISNSSYILYILNHKEICTVKYILTSCHYLDEQGLTSDKKAQNSIQTKVLPRWKPHPKQWGSKLVYICREQMPHSLALMILLNHVMNCLQTNNHTQSTNESTCLLLIEKRFSFFKIPLFHWFIKQLIIKTIHFIGKDFLKLVFPKIWDMPRSVYMSPLSILRQDLALTYNIVYFL